MTSETLAVAMMTKIAVSLPLTPDIQAKARAMAAQGQPVVEKDRDQETQSLNTKLKGIF